MNFILVFVGGGLGTVARHAVNVLTARWAMEGWPLGTFCINIAGSFLMGVIGGMFLKHTGLPPELRLFLATGILGGFTTFSAYALEVVLLHERGATFAAFIYAIGSIALGVAALASGLALTR